MNHKIIYTFNPLWLIKVDKTRIQNQNEPECQHIKKREKAKII